MTVTSKVLWKEGLFIRPHHFQQEHCFFEDQIKRILDINAFGGGFETLDYEEKLFPLGKFSIAQCKGVLADGTLFSLPVSDALPSPIEIDSSAISKVVYLCLPLNVDGNIEVNYAPNDGISHEHRSKLRLTEIKDTHSELGDYAQIELMSYHFVLKLETEELSGYATLPVAKIKDVTVEGGIIIDDEFSPMALCIGAIPQLISKLCELTDLISQRANILASRVNNPQQSGVADVNDFLMLLSLNRLQPLFRSLSTSPQQHPYKAYELLSMSHGELATFMHEEHVSNEFYDYIHASPHLSLGPLYLSIKSFLSTISCAKAVSLPITASEYGTYIARVNDATLYDSSEFIIAVKAKLQPEFIKSSFVQQTKISTVEQIEKLVHLQLPGIPLQALPVAPRYLPYHAGFVYFQLDKTSEYWNNISTSSGFGVHVAGNYPDLEMEFWAVRGTRV